jgi:TatD DNase family protein
VIVPDLFDTHAHLHFPEFAGDLDAVLARARAAGVRRMLTIGTDVATSCAAAALAQREPDVWAAVGIHPHEAADADDAALAEIERLASAPRVVAIGETGLDFFRDRAPREAQTRAFRAQVALARRLGKPVLVHCRDAHAETLALLAADGALERGGIMHCFTGDLALARRCIELGLLVSLAWPVTYPKPGALPEVARMFRPIGWSSRRTARSCRPSLTVASATSRLPRDHRRRVARAGRAPVRTWPRACPRTPERCFGL